MTGEESQDKSALDSALLFLSREVQVLAALLERFLAPAECQALARVAGRRKAGKLSAAQQVADILPYHPKLRKAVVQALWEALPTEPKAADFAPDDAEAQSQQTLRSALAHDMVLAEGEARQRLLERMTAWQNFIEAKKDAADETGATSKSKAKPKTEIAPAVTAEEKVAALKQQLLDARRAQSQLEEEMGQERKRHTELKEQLIDAVAERRVAISRAARWKKKLADSFSATDREKNLMEEADDARQGQHLAEQKLDLLVWERDDLRACLEDRERFHALVEEEVPSFHNRPLLQKEQDLAALMAETGLPFRVLVVGGGEPQYRHRDKLKEYAEVMGFTSTWRMAEYVSWHKEMDKLATDMNTRYDALVILHWNRTTFTKKAREVCNQSGQKPCITCYYEGFTSLRETLQECLRQLLGRAK
ncbi:MAG: hypothetical protein O3A95_05780 [Planctomycetota bacterium]|nr:hypothetical protein [Planctomycetota bacterium]MDA1113797.1 hypothetical protein [Planctomycetota bacterium]